ncbi:MAG TPA: hypothetical protein VGQ26_16360 [Streptosporangiaceae bacterium]|jgi:hypothetical protein|nr:hypothetical protein [Streptosporangiaceae bacterium]
MKIQAEDAVARAMDWLAQLREEDGTEPSSDAGGKPTADAVPPVPVPRAAAEPQAAERLAAEPRPAGQDAESLSAVPLAAEPKPAGQDAESPPAVPLAAEPPHAAPPTVEPLAPVSAEPHSVEPESVERQPHESAAAEPSHAASLAAEPAGAEPQPGEPLAAETPLAAPLATELVGAEPLSFEPLTAEPLAPLPPVPSAAEPLAPLPPVPVPRAADVPPVAAWASAAWATAAAPAAAVPPTGPPVRRTRLRTSVEITERSAIGDELRIPIAWCEMGSCISRHEDPAALGEADIRARAVAEGWRVDALGRLACPKCQQSDAWFWTAHPVAPWDRETAVARTTLMAAVVREHAAFTDATDRERGMIPDARPAIGISMARGRHREHPGRPRRGPAEESRESHYTV